MHRCLTDSHTGPILEDMSRRSEESTKTSRKGSKQRLPQNPDAAKPAASSGIAELRSRYGLSREKFGRLSGFSVRGLANWESGVQEPGEQARLRLAELDRLQRALARVVSQEALGNWLDTPNPAFDGLKPLEVIERGQVDRLWQMVFLVESGVPF